MDEENVNKEEIIRKFHQLKQKIYDKSEELYSKGMTVEEARENIQSEIDEFTNFTFLNRDILIEHLKQELKESIDSEISDPTNVIFMYLIMSGFGFINKECITIK